MYSRKIRKRNYKKIYNLAEVYHSENIEKVSDELIENGSYDIITTCKYKIPTIWELGRIYQRLIIMVTGNEEEYVETLVEVLSSWIIEKIDNYNSSMYYENPSYIYECYIENKIF